MDVELLEFSCVSVGDIEVPGSEYLITKIDLLRFELDVALIVRMPKP